MLTNRSACFRICSTRFSLLAMAVFHLTGCAADQTPQPASSGVQDKAGTREHKTPPDVVIDSPAEGETFTAGPEVEIHAQGQVRVAPGQWEPVTTVCNLVLSSDKKQSTQLCSSSVALTRKPNSETYGFEHTWKQGNLKPGTYYLSLQVYRRDDIGSPGQPDRTRSKLRIIKVKKAK